MENDTHGDVNEDERRMKMDVMRKSNVEVEHEHEQVDVYEMLVVVLSC